MAFNLFFPLGEISFPTVSQDSHGVGVTADSSDEAACQTEPLENQVQNCFLSPLTIENCPYHHRYGHLRVHLFSVLGG